VSVTRTPLTTFRRQSYPRLVSTLALSTAAAIAWSQTMNTHSMATQTEPPVATPVAEMPTGNAAPLRYDSAFGRYKSYREEKATPWRDANDTVTQIGGWRVYAKEAQQPEPVSATTVPTTPASPLVVKPNPHEGHGGKQ
jgi:hypothetical protein